MWKLILLAALAGFSRASDVLEFTDADFESKIVEHDLILVEFFAPWCGHCKHLAPEYEKAATTLKGTVPLAKVDCTVNTKTCSKYDVSGYPTLKIFRGGEVSGPYDGPRSAAGIVSFLKRQAGPASVVLEDEEQLQKFTNNDDASVVGFFADDKSAAQAEFVKAANALRDDYRFGYTNSEALLQGQGVDGEGIILFRPPHLSNKFENSFVTYSEDKFTSSKIQKFIQDNIFGICPVMTNDNKDRMSGKDLLVAYFDVDYKKNLKGTNYWRNRVMKVAKGFLDEGKKLNFAVANRKDFHGDVIDFGLDKQPSSSPVVAMRSAKGQKYAMTEEFSMEALQRFLEDYFAGNLKPYLKSEPIPENNDKPVKVVVAENFDEIVNDDSKDVLIEFYAPWCGHCKNLEPKYNELAEKLSSDPNVVIAKMDATANDVPSPYQVSGFPTIFFSPAGRKMNPKKYEGGREVKDFISYLKKEATNTLVVPEESKKKKRSEEKTDL